MIYITKYLTAVWFKGSKWSENWNLSCVNYRMLQFNAGKIYIKIGMEKYS